MTRSNASDAQTAKAQRATKRALGLLRGAARLLAEAGADVDLVAELEVRDRASELELAELVHRHLAQRGTLEVVVLARPRPPR